jgi:hypothetical protein
MGKMMPHMVRNIERQKKEQNVPFSKLNFNFKDMFLSSARDMVANQSMNQQNTAAQTKDNVEDITDQAKKNKKKLTSVAATTGAGSTLLG